VQRHKRFLSDNSPGQTLVLIQPYTFPIDYEGHGLAGRPLDKWDFENELNEYVDLEIARTRYFNEYTSSLDNDYIPALGAGAGIGTNSAFFSNADIIFGNETSWVHPVLSDIKMMDNLSFSSSNRWMSMMSRMTERLVDRCEGDYIPTAFGHFDPLDMANALRGNQLFYDFFDIPEQVKELLRRSADAIVQCHRHLNTLLPKSLDMTGIAGMAFPRDTLFMSEDNADLCSVEIYEEFGKPYAQMVIDQIGGAFIHHHAKGIHIHKDILGLRGLRTLEISWDPNCVRPIDCLESLLDQHGDVPLMIRCTARDVFEKIDVIRQGRVVLMLNADNLDEAKAAVKLIRKHSNH
jgi:hypothetical protein